MKMTNKEIRKKIKEIQSKLPSLKDEKTKLQNAIKTKREDLTQIKDKFYSNFPQEEANNPSIKKDLETNNKLHDIIFSLYKSIINKSKKKLKIEYSLESLQLTNHQDQRQLNNSINNLLQESRHLDDNIAKARKDIEKCIRSNSIKFDKEHYIINPAYILVDHIAEFALGKLVQRRLERLLKHSKNESEEITEEYNERIKELEDIKGKYHIEIPSMNLFKRNTLNTNTNTNTIEIKLSSKDLLPEGGEREKYESNIDFIDLHHEQFPCEEEYDDDTSIEVDTSVLNKKNLERFIESPRFIDKVSNNTIVLTKPIKDLRFDLIDDLKNNIRNPTETVATLLKVKHIEKEKESLAIINAKLDETNQSIKTLQKDYDMLLKHNKQLKKKHMKLKDNIIYANNKIEIISDQIELLSQEANTHNSNHQKNHLDQRKLLHDE